MGQCCCLACSKGTDSPLSERRHIDDDNTLYRWIHPDHLKCGAITSAAFKHKDVAKTRELSVDVAEWTTAAQVLSFANNPGTRLGVLLTGAVRALGQCVNHDPLPKRDSHALIVGDKPGSMPKKLARLCSLLDV